jgi:hypothetical protein
MHGRKEALTMVSSHAILWQCEDTGQGRKEQYLSCGASALILEVVGSITGSGGERGEGRDTARERLLQKLNMGWMKESTFACLLL